MKNKKNILSLKICLGIFVAIIMIGLFSSSLYSKKYLFLTEKKQSKFTPDQVLQDLINGNRRFYLSKKIKRPSLVALSKKAHKHGQFPKAVILACMDSRSVPEIIFDQSIADIFTLRVAGNVINDEMLASFEYATKHAGSKLIVIMGHTQCGAIQAVCKGGLKGNLESLARAIEPAVEMIKKEIPDMEFDCGDTAITSDIALQNVRNMKAKVIHRSKVIRKLLSSGEIKIVGALHDLETGVVTFE